MKLKIASAAIPILIALVLTGCSPSNPETPPANSTMNGTNDLMARTNMNGLASPNPATANDATPTAQDKVPLKLDVPKPLLVGTPVPITIPNLEKPREGKRPDFMVPPGTTNLAAGKKVTSSDAEPVTGTLDLVTDGDKMGDEGSWVELGPGKQWVQIDLGQQANIYAVLLWHYHSQRRAYRAVAVQISDDPKFATGVTTIYNTDYANELGFGAGKDLAYVETNEGKLIDAKGTKGRYVRLYSNGNTSNKMNHYVEVEVFGKPAS